LCRAAAHTTIPRAAARCRARVSCRPSDPSRRRRQVRRTSRSLRNRASSHGAASAPRLSLASEREAKVAARAAARRAAFLDELREKALLATERNQHRRTRRAPRRQILVRTRRVAERVPLPHFDRDLVARNEIEQIRSTGFALAALANEVLQRLTRDIERAALHELDELERLDLARCVAEAH